MLAATLKDPDALDYPVSCTPKVDGIRCLTFTGGAPKSRSLKPIPNLHIQAELEKYGVDGLDGELWIPGAENFGEVSSAVMRKDGEPVFEYLVFDMHNIPQERYGDRVKAFDILPKPHPPWLKFLRPVLVYDAEGFLKYWDKCANEGYEGVMSRQEGGIYKYGRSTHTEQLLLKYKMFQDDEAEIIGFEEMMTNNNPKVKNNLGESERSTSKAGKVPAGVLGKWKVRDLKTGVEFEVGTGFSAKQRKDYWRNRQVHVGDLIKYKHQPHGGKGKPRFPSFQGFRHRDDM
jgi:DNA ligase-1